MVLSGEADGDGVVWVARPAGHWLGGGGGDGEAAADNDIVDGAGCGFASADACAEGANGCNDLGVEELGESGRREDARIDLDIACNDERGSTGAGVCAQCGQDYAVFVGEAAPRNNVDGEEDDRSVGTAVDLHGDGAAKDGGACADGADRAASDEYTDVPAGAVASAKECAGDVKPPVVAGGPSAEVVDVVAHGVKLLRGDDGGGGVAEEGLEAGN